MKKALKWLLPVMVIALLVGALCVIAYAETEEPKVYYSVTVGGVKTDYYYNDLRVDNNGNAVTAVTTWTDGTVVEVYDDIVWEASNYNIHISGTVTLKLNGHTLTMKGKEENSGKNMAGRFNANSGSNFTVLGGTLDGKKGSIVPTVSGSKFYTGGGNTTLDGVSIVTTITTFDYRKGTLTVKNCDVTHGSTVIFLAGDNSDSSVKLVIENSAFTATNVTGNVISAGRNGYSASSGACVASVEIKNSTFNSNQPVFFTINHVQKDANTCFDNYNGNLASISIDGTSVINMPNANFCTANNVNYYEKFQVTLAEGATVNCKGWQAVTTGTTSKLELPADCVKAGVSANDNEYAFKVVKPTEAATVTFKNGDTVVGTKLMAKGFVPAHAFQTK